MADSGRKSKYETHVQPRIGTIRAWCRDGLTEKEICRNLGIGHTAFNRYKGEYAELRESLKAGKDDALAQVENAHFRMATGYEYEEIRSVTDDSGREHTERVRKHIPPNVTAQIFFLKNRAPGKWSDKRENMVNQDTTAFPRTVIYLPDNGRGDRFTK